MNNKYLIEQLQSLGFAPDEAKVYLELLKKPATHLALARKTGVNRSKVYRIAEGLEKRGLITKTVDDQGKTLVANDPHNLQIELVEKETLVKRQKETLIDALPLLQNIPSLSQEALSINTYYGTGGFKQMLWNETKTEGELLVFGYGPLEALTGSHEWSEKHRRKTLEQGYHTRELKNPTDKKPANFTEIGGFMDFYQVRTIPTEVLDFKGQLVIYNQTVSIYNFHSDQKVGCEINSAFLATMLRQVFEHYWKIAK